MTIEDFQEFIATDCHRSKKHESSGTSETNLNQLHQPIPLIDIDQLPVSDRIKFLIKHGKDGTYVSRSEADMAVITVLVNKGVSESEIKQIFSD